MFYQKMKKILFLWLICAVILFILVNYSAHIEYYWRQNYVKIITPSSKLTSAKDISCYNETSTDNGLQEFDPQIEKEELRLGRNIFFHETSCFGEEGLLLNARPACAVESAARMNPNMTVYLLFLSPSKIADSSKQMIRQLLSYENIKVRRVYINNYVKHTPLEEWYASGILRTSSWPRSHMSDILRYLTLWKYGGIYLDLDVVVIKSFEGLNNFAGAEDEENVAAGVIGFGIGNLGRKMAKACLKDLKDQFDGQYWWNNGPGVITRVLQKLCSKQYARDMTLSQCKGFSVLSSSAFYPIHYSNWKMYFDLESKDTTMWYLKNSTAIHVWNKLSKLEKVQVGSEVAYGIIAQRHCPKIYNNCGAIF